MSQAQSLFEKVWADHIVTPETDDTPAVLYVDLHLIHEVTTPQAFQMLKDAKLKVRMPERTFGTLDHIIPTTDQARPYADHETAQTDNTDHYDAAAKAFDKAEKSGYAAQQEEKKPNAD